ncbi:MAG: hypothetical protein J7K15_10285 [Deltaproteobacteria bacterium]|nr:hypothetical protein [Deltaproteobacteria bacterium]
MTRKEYTTILISKEDRDLLKRYREAGRWRGIAEMVVDVINRTGCKEDELPQWYGPRCPHCEGPLSQKFASARLVCLRCGREYELREVKPVRYSKQGGG